MKTKLKYVPFAIASSIVSIIALIGTYIVYSSLNQLMNGEGDYFSTLSSFSMSSLSNGAKLFGFGCLAVAVVSIILIVYFIYEERKLSIIITGVIGIIEFILFVHFFDTIGSALSNIGSYLFGSDFSYNDIIGSMHSSLLIFDWCNYQYCDSFTNVSCDSYFFFTTLYAFFTKTDSNSC